MLEKNAENVSSIEEFIEYINKYKYYKIDIK